MKILKYILLPAVAAVTMSVGATSYVFVPANDSATTRLCVSAANNNLMNYRRIAVTERLKPAFVANKVTCNEQNIVNFAAKYSAMKTAAYINKFRKHHVTITDLASASDQQGNSDDVVIITVN